MVHQEDDQILSDKEIKEMYAEIIAEEKLKKKLFEDFMSNLNNMMGQSWYDELIDNLDPDDLEMNMYFNPEIVDYSKGQLQELHGSCIKERWVNPTVNGGMSGDEFAGEIYFKLVDNNYALFYYAW